ncbi:AAA family ATPase [Longitalea arenae]|uniref:AAA family ATPase n=1 Tax=Longitalea arenae TaxID=2812558 RepID=UPI001967A462|nr:AAA family ATPase [Longitalea arenae]
MEAIDAAYLAFTKILDEINSYGLSIFSEQDTRVKVIDRIMFEVFNYEYDQVQTEPSSGTGFIDYKISINGIGKLVIEAKKDGLDFNIDTAYSGRGFLLNGPVFSDGIVTKGLYQTIYYASQESIELGCLTNGKTWIIFRANRLADGKKVIEGKGIVFGSLEGIKKNFKLFYELLSPKSITKNQFRAIFQELEGQQIRVKEFSKTLKTEESLKIFDSGSYSNDFDRVMTTFFSKLSGDDDAEFLIDCFVETKESQAAEFQLTRISEDLLAKIKSIETVEGEAIQEIIERIKVTNKHEFVILIGGKGAGKSTFIERFFNHVLSSNLKEECIVIKVSLAEYKGNELEITNWLDNNLLEECEKTLYNGFPSYDEIQGIFYFEYDRLRFGTWKGLYEQNKEQFKIEFGRHIEHRRETRPTEYIKRLIGDIVKSRKKIPCIIFDNADHFSIEIQEKVFQYARAIYEREVCLVIVPITDKTSWQLSKQGAIQSYENEALFLPTPPPQKVIEKRIQYIEKKISKEKSTKGHYFLKKGIKLELKNLEGFARYLQLIFLHDKQIARWIGALANYDTRRCLDLSKDLISSPHLSIDEFLRAYTSTGTEDLLIKPTRVKTALIKKNYTSYPINHHSFVQNVYYLTGNVNTSPILSLRILQVLNDKKSDKKAEDSLLNVDQILDYFNAMGIERSITFDHLNYLLGKRLISSYDPTITDINFAKRVELTPAGHEHYIWGSNDYVYMYAMLEVTPITDENLYETVIANYYNYKQRQTMLYRFLEYLMRQDSLYCQIPNHPSYKGQELLSNLFSSNSNYLSKRNFGNHRPSKR